KEATNGRNKKTRANQEQSRNSAHPNSWRLRSQCCSDNFLSHWYTYPHRNTLKQGNNLRRTHKTKQNKTTKQTESMFKIYQNEGKNKNASEETKVDVVTFAG